MKRMLLLFAFALAVILSGCASAPDTKEDPLDSFSIDAVLPFETAAPEALIATPTPAPTPNWEEIAPTQVDQSWKNDDTVDDEPEESDDYDDYGYDEPEPAATPTGYTTLQQGDSGSAVKRLQQRLKTLGYYSGSADGAYGSGTTTAVKRFQAVIGLNQTGVANKTTQQELFASGAPKYAPTPTPAPTAQYTTLEKGDSGSRVTRLQNRLKTLGFYTGSADGEYGSATVSAVKRFQKALGVDQTGSASAALQKKLFASSAPYYEAPTPAPAPTAEYVRLASGSSGTRVSRLQQRLRSLGYYSGTVDGEYGAGTVRAVKLFQQALDVDPTGVATASLQKKLYASGAPAYDGEADDSQPEDEYITLEPGDSGTDVKKLQKRLKTLGYFSGEIGGNYLTQTTNAVKLFQKALGVKQTGVATVALQKKLFSAQAPYYEDDEDDDEDDADTLTELRVGDSNAKVRRMQERLSELGYYSGTINGNFGAKTEEAVMRFEARHGKDETGIATVALLKKLYSTSALPYEEDDPYEPESTASPYMELKRGNSGTKVKRLQRRLKELGFFSGEIGGNYLDLTEDAVKLFQKAIGVKQTGTATVALQERIFADDAPYYSPDADPAEPVKEYTELQRGSKGSAVGTLQNRLLELGYLMSKSDVTFKTFDKATMLAVIDAQMARGVESDGSADQDFLTYIYSDDAWLYAPNAQIGG